MGLSRKRRKSLSIYLRNFAMSRRAAALALAKRHVDGAMSLDDFSLELEDQNGKKIHLASEADQQYAFNHLVLLST